MDGKSETDAVTENGLSSEASEAGDRGGEVAKFEYTLQWVIRLDWYYTMFFLYSIVCIFFMLISASFFRPNMIYVLFISAFSTIAFVLLSMASFLMLLVQAFIERWEKHKYNIVAKEYLDELAANPEEQRRDVILKCLSYALWKIESGYSGFRFGAKSIGYYIDSRRHELDFKRAVIRRIASFIYDSVYHLDGGKTGKLYKEIGNCLETENLEGLVSFLEKNTGPLKRIEGRKSLAGYPTRGRISRFAIWLQGSYRPLIAAAILSMWALYAAGLIPHPVI